MPKSDIYTFECSNCGERTVMGQAKRTAPEYCPWCGEPWDSQ